MEEKNLHSNTWNKVLIFFLLFVYLLHCSSAKPTPQKEDPDYDFSSVPYGLFGTGPNPYEEGAFFEGDIAGVKHSSILDKNVILDPSKKWLTTTIPYVIDPFKFNGSDLEVIHSAFEEYANLTCITFVPITTKHSDFLVISALEGCWSFVGRRGGPQTISLQNPGCVHRGIVVHELMHALGVWHEQSRFDRDDFVIINWSNIKEENKHNFHKRELNDSQTFGLDYDYGSIMHYSAYSFAINQSIPTMVPKKKDAILGQRHGLSQTDVDKINKLYECSICKNQNDNDDDIYQTLS